METYCFQDPEHDQPHPVAAGISPGEEVIFCSHTFVATAGAIHFTGAIPIPVECGDDHLIDPISVEAAITRIKS